MLSNSPVMAVIPAEDLDRALAFYTDILGLHAATDKRLGFVIFKAGKNSRVMIYQRGRTTAEHTALHFTVPDLEATARALTEKGVKLEQYDFPGLKTNEMGIAEYGGTTHVWFVDPEGNVVTVVNAI
jgi:catechol 2,3-dioxygenase-like lactoylglutathione lyase family enzyme